MANTGSPRGRGRLRGSCGPVTRARLVTVLLAATLCSASYCLGIWHNSRGAADSRVLGPSAVLAAAASCGGDEPLDFAAHHSAEAAGLSVSASSSATSTTASSTRRALRRAPHGSAGPRERSAGPQEVSRAAWAGDSGRTAAEAAGGNSWAARFDDDNLRLTNAGAARA